MKDSLTKFTAAAAALFIALLSGLGVGSGGLLVIWLTMIEGVSPERARGLNLMFFVFSAGAALLVHLSRRRIKLGLVAVLAVCACLGTLAGAWLASLIAAGLLRRIFGGMLVLSGAYTIYSKFFKKRGELLPSKSAPRQK